ncbi:hypothetical protein [Thermostichus sp. MS-CIW-37]
MSKNKDMKSFSKPVTPNSKLENKAVPSHQRGEINSSSDSAPSEQRSASVRPEHTSLLAYKHIQQYMRSQGKEFLSQEDLNAVLRLSQHLRVFGLLSAIGYVNQSNAQEGKVRQRTVPVWTSLLGQLVTEDNSLEPKALMQRIQALASDQPVEYLALWRRSLILANHWNFWARAYLSGDTNGENTDVHGAASN